MNSRLRNARNVLPAWEEVQFSPSLPLYFCNYDCITACLCWESGESLTVIPLFSSAWQSLPPISGWGHVFVLGIFPSSTLGVQCSRDFYYAAPTALGELKVMFSTCVLLLLDRTHVFLAILNGLTFEAV